MEEDFESSDISAAQLAAIQNKGQFARSISLALSADTISAPASKQDRGKGPETNSASGQGDADESFKAVEEEVAELGARGDFSSEESDISSDDDIGSVEETPLPTQDAAHRRRKTKMQRQRMRQMLRTEFLERFTRGSDSEDDIEIVKGADRPQRVPTLMELCMQKGLERSGPLPPGLKPVVSQHRNRTRLAAVQLRWLCHNLAVLEVQIKWNMVEVLLPHGVKTFMLRRDARSLWRTNVAIYGRSYMNPPPERHPEEGQWILPVSLQNLASVDWKIAALAHYLNLTLPHHYSSPNLGTQSRSEESQRQRRVNLDVFHAKQYLQKWYPNLVQHCFDLALAYVWWSRGLCTRAQEAFLKVIQHYPADQDSSETQHSTLWARHKAMVLVDIGRLLVSFDRCDSAGRFYREAVELATRNIYQREVSKLTLQSLALAASAYDQGLMDRHSAIQAARLWRTTTEHAQTIEDSSPWSPENHRFTVYQLDPHQEQGQRDAVLAAIESLLHCHAGCSTDSLNQGSMNALQRNTSWLREARACLEKLLQPRCALVGLHLSMIIAMLGEGVAAENAFNFHMLRFGFNTQLPGSVAMRLSEDFVKPHPWWLFQEWIDIKTKAMGKVIGVHLRVLPLVWRRGFGHPSYCHDRNTTVSREQAADVQGVTPDLYVTPEGHLSAAMVQNLPPLRTVCLDLHTGKVLFDCSCSEQPHKWDNFCPSSEISTDDKFAKFRIDCNQMLPQPIVVYMNPTTSATVSVVVMNCMKPYYQSEAAAEWAVRGRQCGTSKAENSDCIRREMWVSMSATFKDATGRGKLDIVELYYQGLKKFLLEKTSSWRDRFEDKYSKVAEEIIDYVIKQHLDISDQGFQCLMMTLSSSKQPLAKTDFHAQTRKACKVLKVTLNNVMYIGKTTAVLSLTSYNHDVFIYLDCTSPSTFSQQVVVKFRSLGSIANWRQLPETRANILLMYKQSVFGNERHRDKYDVLVLDEKGNILHSDFDKKRESDLQIIVCHGDKLLQTEARTSVVSLDFKTKNLRYSQETFAEITSLAIAQNILFVLTQEGVHALDVDTLEPMVVVHHGRQQGANASGSNDAGLLLLVTNATNLDVLGSHEVSIGGDRAGQYYLIFLGFENHILSLRRRKTCDDEGASDVVEVWDIMVPGKPTELCHISEQAGFVVSATVFSNKTDRYYRESLYWFSSSGDLIAIHPFLGGGRHGFLPVYMNDPALEGTDDEKGKDGQGVWHLYFADGLGALCCIKLEVLENQ